MRWLAAHPVIFAGATTQAKRVDVRLCFQLLPQRLVNAESPQHLPGKYGPGQRRFPRIRRQVRMSGGTRARAGEAFLHRDAKMAKKK